MLDGRLNVNVALNRPAYQTSVYTDPQGSYPATNANDGDTNPYMHQGTCAIITLATNPWWAVDLMVALYVLGVRFTNRDGSRTSADVVIMIILTRKKMDVEINIINNNNKCQQQQQQQQQ